MSQAPAPVLADQVGRSTQIVVAALIMGLVFFGAIAFTVARGGQAQPGPVSLIGALFFAINVVVSIVMSRSATARKVQEIAAQNPADWRQALAPVYTTKFILADAPLEGAGFFNGVAYIVDGHWMNLAILICLVALMAITFPSQSQFEAWVEQVRRDHS